MQDELRKMAADFAEALAGGDAARVAALYADDGTLLTPAAELVAGRDELEAYCAGIELGVSRIELEAGEVEVTGRVAVEIGRYVLAVGAGRDAASVDRGKYLVLYRQQTEGGWRRAVDVFNPDGLVSRRRQKEEP
jgi:uncharacterized protein (TIGR02246 family)